MRRRFWLVLTVALLASVSVTAIVTEQVDPTSNPPRTACGSTYLDSNPQNGQACLPNKHGPGFAAARADWCLEWTSISSADQGVPLEASIDALLVGDSGLTADRKTGSYSNAISWLRSIENSPDAMGTKAEYAQEDRDIRELDAFFGTGSYLLSRQYCP